MPNFVGNKNLIGPPVGLVQGETKLVQALSSGFAVHLTKYDVFDQSIIMQSADHHHFPYRLIAR